MTPWFTFKEWLSEGYVDWALYLSSFSPLPALLSIRLWGQHDEAAPRLMILFLIMMLPLAHVLLDTRKVTGRQYRVNRVYGAAGEITGYVAAYILPLVVIGSLIWSDYVAYGLFMLIVGVIMTRGDLLHINPWVYLFGWRLYNISLKDDDRYYLLTKSEPQPGEVIQAKKLRNRLLISEAP